MATFTVCLSGLLAFYKQLKNDPVPKNKEKYFAVK